MSDDNQTTETPTETPTPDAGKTDMGIDIPKGDTPPASDTPASDSPPTDPPADDTPPPKLEIPEQFRTKDGQANVEALLTAVTDLRKKLGDNDKTPPPEPPENYELNVPKVDGVSIDKNDPLFTAAVDFAKANKISQEQFDGLVKIHVDSIAKSAQDASAADVETMKTRYGENWVNIGQGAVNKLAAALKWQDGDPLHQAISELGNSAAGLQALIALSNTVGEQTPPSAKDSTTTPAADTVESLKKLMWEERYQTDEAFRNNVMERLARLQS